MEQLLTQKPSNNGNPIKEGDEQAFLSPAQRELLQLSFKYRSKEFSHDFRLKKKASNFRNIVKKCVKSMTNKVREFNLDDKRDGAHADNTKSNQNLQNENSDDESSDGEDNVNHKKVEPLNSIPELSTKYKRVKEDRSDFLAMLDKNVKALHEDDSSGDEKEAQRKGQGPQNLTKKQEMVLWALVAAMRKAAAREQKKELEVFAKDMFQLPKLPGDKSLTQEVLKFELDRHPRELVAKGNTQKLKEKIGNSTTNILKVKTGRGLMETFKDSTRSKSSMDTGASHTASGKKSSMMVNMGSPVGKGTQSVTNHPSSNKTGTLQPTASGDNQKGSNNKQSALPVFQDKDYTQNLSQLLVCKDLEHSFNLQKYNGQYDKFVAAMDKYEELREISVRRQQEVAMQAFDLFNAPSDSMLDPTFLTQQSPASTFSQNGSPQKSGVLNLQTLAAQAQQPSISPAVDQNLKRKISLSPAPLGADKGNMFGRRDSVQQIQNAGYINEKSFAKRSQSVLQQPVVGGVQVLNQQSSALQRKLSSNEVNQPSIKTGGGSPTGVGLQSVSQTPVIKQQSYKELNERLQYPTNPAYFKQSKKDDDSAKFASGQTFIDYCREHNLPFNQTDRLMYRVQQIFY